MDARDDGAGRHPWLGVEVRHLATLIAVERSRSFRQAAGELGYAQSVVSEHIGELERVVGARLVERRHGGRRVTLTPAGRLLLGRGRRIVLQLSAVRTAISQLENAGRPTVRLAVAGRAPELLTRLLPEPLERHPRIRLHVSEAADASELAAAIDGGRADLGVGPALARPRLSTATLALDPFVFLVRRDSALAAARRVTRAEQLGGERVIVPASAMPEARALAGGLDLEPAAHAPLAATVPRLVAEGIGVGLLPASEVTLVRSDLVVLSTTGLVAPRRVALCWATAPGRPAAVEAFRAALLRALERAVGLRLAVDA